MEPPAKSSKLAKPQTLDLPRDVMIIIFLKLGVFDLLLHARYVCSFWRAIANDPRLYTVIHIIKCSDIPDGASKQVEAIAIEAIKRSRGQLVELSIEHFCTDQILYALMRASPLLKVLRLTSRVHFTEACLINVIQKLKLLEEVEFLDCSFQTTGAIEAVGSSCPNLKLFRLNPRPKMPRNIWDNVAFAVVENMNSGLRTLDMPDTFVTDVGLEALLGRFIQLEYLGIRVCHDMANGDLDRDLLAKFKGIRISAIRNW